MVADTSPHFPIGAPAEWAGKQEGHLQYGVRDCPTPRDDMAGWSTSNLLVF